MAFLTLITVAGGTLAAAIAARRKADPPRLIDALIDGEPKRAILLPPQAQRVMTRVQAGTQDLLGDTRQKYQQALSTTYAGDAETRAEAIGKRDLKVAATGLALASAAALATPILYLPSALCTLYVMRSWIRVAYSALVEEWRVDYRLIFALTIPAALAGGFFWAAAFGSLFSRVNWYLAAKTENRSKRTVADLFGGQIRTVWLLVDGIEVEAPFEQVQQDDTVVVHAGQMIPVDGAITQGTATIDQHMLTGEAQPAEKGVGDEVLASTVVFSGRICIQVEKAGNATVAAQITTMLSQTTDFKRTLQSRTDRWLNCLALPILGVSALALPVAGVGGAVAVLWYYPGARMMVFGPMSMLSYLQVA
ncbi:MAG: hypothetical protein KDE46_29120, partial [Caldilineaceae bacterium]|nr:hypothetical protein [Caldilineaceae bacterium]